MILLIDNYDSFSYNLYQLTGEIEPDIKIIRNDEMTVDEIKSLTVLFFPRVRADPKMPELLLKPQKHSERTFPFSVFVLVIRQFVRHSVQPLPMQRN